MFQPDNCHIHFYFYMDNFLLNNYNIWNAGGTVSIEDTGFYTISPVVTMDDEFSYGDDVVFNGTFYWGYAAALDMEYSIDGVDASTTVSAGRFSEDLGTGFAVGTHTEGSSAISTLGFSML